jgi:hypothetical protein
MPQVVECLSSKGKPLSSNPILLKQTNKQTNNCPQTTKKSQQNEVRNFEVRLIIGKLVIRKVGEEKYGQSYIDEQKHEYICVPLNVHKMVPSVEE